MAEAMVSEREQFKRWRAAQDAMQAMRTPEDYRQVLVLIRRVGGDEAYALGEQAAMVAQARAIPSLIIHLPT